MQNDRVQTTALLITERRGTAFLALVFFLLLMFWHPLLWAAPEKQKPSKRSAPAAGASVKTSAINDSNIQETLKRADEMVKKGEVESPLKILLGVYEYSKELLSTVKFFQGHYDKVVNDPATPQAEKEEVYLKLKRMGQLIPKYNAIKGSDTGTMSAICMQKRATQKRRVSI